MQAAGGARGETPAGDRPADAAGRSSIDRHPPLARVARARVCAYAVLRRVFERGAYADLALRSHARELDARDRALAMRLAYGAVQRRGTLDHLIERLAERPREAPRRAAAGGAAAGALRAVVSRGRSRPRGGGGRGGAGEGGDGKGGRRRRGSRAGRGGHGLVNAVLRRATREGAALLAELDDDTPSRRRRSSTPTRSGSRGCGGRSWAPRRRGRCWRSTTSRGSWRCG